MRWIVSMALVAGLVGAAPAPGFADTAGLEIVNDLRAEKGRKALVHSPKLERIALQHAKDMQRRNKLTHNGPRGEKMGKRIRNAGYSYCKIAENIAQGPWDTAKVISVWESSAPHRKNMLNPQVTEFGMAKAGGGYYVMILGKPC